ncbi:MAG: hypothetical protein A3C35_00760 [Omnitrophica bacterium RIFCSPHIGHO2_02_FULL_46_11]|nr:MAG: hypothetical protein A3C35_00760 [Omnitrophica bacterium RIFCSPHIGHO2_02_FULL_46_11]OGW87693.1 MAG: hypothetical protein A3A81_04135 [Omnitrophica bacterium RIFCSPLOWO2_01_FULL_45_10b]
MIQLGIIGCGTIGSALAKAVEKKFSRIARLAYVSDINPVQIEKFRKKIAASKFRAVPVSHLIQKSDFIIETASLCAAEQVIPKVLKSGKDILVLSVGGILNIKHLQSLIRKSRGHIYIPSGGIAGIDAVLASKTGTINSVRITTRKPLSSLQNSPYFLRNRSRLGAIRKPKLVFEGNAAEAIRNFPENVNVAVTLSLAGIGPERTRVRIFTSPTYRYNMHEIEIKSSFGQIVTHVTNIPARENPKTSALAIGSAVATLEKIFSRFKIGT